MRSASRTGVRLIPSSRASSSSFSRCPGGSRPSMIASRMTSPAAALALCGANSRPSSRLPPTEASIQYAILRYDLVHEEDARDLVLSVFTDVRARMPFVPAIFKALAQEPSALLLAWLQARAL